MSTSRKINLGCGPYKEPGFINIDVSPRWNPEILRDLRRGLPFDDYSVAEIRAYHFLEHLAWEDVIFILEECYRVLQLGGLLDIILPLGLTGDLDHKIIVTERTFDGMAKRPDDWCAYYRTNMRWKELKRDVFEDGGIACLSLHFQPDK